MGAVDLADDRDDALQRARSLVAGARRLVVLTGAGISTDSGIPDFRGPAGVWTKDPEAEKLATLQHYLADPEIRRRAWQIRVESPNWAARPNRGHLALADFERTGRLHVLVTQNVDGLHQAAGSDPAGIVEVHGTMHWSLCWGCRDRRPMLEIVERVRAGEDDPPCRRCGGVLKSDTISFGQALVAEVIERALRSADECDVLLTVGTSLQVYPVANVVGRARAAGAAVVILNGEPTKLDRLADVVLLASISEVLPTLLEHATQS